MKDKTTSFHANNTITSSAYIKGTIIEFLWNTLHIVKIPFLSCSLPIIVEKMFPEGVAFLSSLWKLYARGSNCSAHLTCAQWHALPNLGGNETTLNKTAEVWELEDSGQFNCLLLPIALIC